MTREEAVEAIKEELEELQMRGSGLMDWKGEPDLEGIANRIFDTVKASED